MAYRQDISNASTQQSALPTFASGTKMNLYSIVWDPIVQQNRAGFRNWRNYTQQSSDTLWTVIAGYEHRTDVISTKFYGSSIYDWILEELNSIADPVQDIAIGEVLIIPALSTILQYRNP